MSCAEARASRPEQEDKKKIGKTIYLDFEDDRESRSVTGVDGESSAASSNGALSVSRSGTWRRESKQSRGERASDFTFVSFSICVKRPLFFPRSRLDARKTVGGEHEMMDTRRTSIAVLRRIPCMLVDFSVVWGTTTYRGVGLARCLQPLCHTPCTRWVIIFLMKCYLHTAL